MAQLNNTPSEDELVGFDDFMGADTPGETIAPEEELVGFDSFLGSEETTTESEYVPLRESLGFTDWVEEEVQTPPKGVTPPKRGPEGERLSGQERARLGLERKLQATAGFFEQGRDQEALTSVEMEQRSEEAKAEMLSDVKFVGESVVSGVAMMADLPALLGNTEVDEEFDRILAEAKGEEYKGQYSFAQASEDAIKRFYVELGMEPTLQKPESAMGVAVQFGLQNIGGSGPIALARNGLKKIGLRGAVLTQMEKTGPSMAALEAHESAAIGVKFFDNYLATEAKISALGGVGAGSFWSLGSTEEQKTQLAHFGNLVFSLAPAASQLLPMAVTYRSVSKAKRELGNPSEFWGKHDKHILANLSKLVPEQNIAEIEARIKEIRQIQTLVEDFNPSVGNIIGTNNARQIQSIIDTDNFEAASSMYKRNKDAVEKLVRKATEASDPAQREVVAKALRMMRQESILQADRLRGEVSRIQQEILGVSRRGMDPDAVGQELKDSLKTAREAYTEHVDNIFKAVDPEGTAKFDVESLKSIISGVTAKSGLGDAVSPDMAGYGFLTKELPQYLKGLRGAGAGAESLSAKLGMQAEPQTINYEELFNLRKALGRESARLRAGNTGTRVPAKLDAIRAELDAMVNNKMKSGDPEVAKRHFESIEVYREEFIPRFEKGAVSNILRLDGKEIQNDKIAETLWRASRMDEVSNLKQLRDIFEESGLNIKDPLLFNAAKETLYTKIEDYAVRDLNTVLTAAADEGKDMLQAFSRWNLKNATKMDAFPTVRKQIDEIGEALSVKNAGIEESLNRIEDLTNNVINKYSKVDAVDLTRKLVGSTPLEVRETFRDLLVRGKLMDDFDPEVSDLRNLDQMIESITDPAKKIQALALRDSISESVTQFLFRRSMKTDGTGFDPQELVRATSGLDDYVKSESLSILLSPKGKSELQQLRTASQLVGQELNPQSKIQLDGITAFLNKFGISAPSVSARLYAAQTHKVGKVYIVADALQRTLRGVSKLNAQATYRETMYNLDGLEKLIEVRKAAGTGDQEALKNLQELGGALKQVLNSVKKYATDPETYRVKLEEALNGHNVLHALRLDRFLDSANDEENSHLDKGQDSALSFYLRVYDNETGQPSRVNGEATLNSLMGEEEGGTLEAPKQQTPTTVDARFGELGQIKNPDGSISTEFSITENIPELGGWVNIPTLVEGQVNVREMLDTQELSDEQRDIAIKRAIERVKSGATLPSYDSLDSAIKAATSRTEEEKMSIYNEVEKEAANDKRDAVSDVYRNLVGEEGASGDTTGAAETGEMGVTSGARSSVKGSENMSDPEIAEAYIGQLNENIPEDVPYEVRYSLLDTSYNIGAGMFKYKGLSKALDNKDWMGVAKNLLDTASIGGESSRGIAARRARAYNRISESQGGPIISRVLQLEDGTLTYLDDKDKTIFSYRPKGGRHETSSVGMLNVQPHEMVASADTSNGA